MEKAFSLFQDDKPDLIITDIVMPDEDGIAFIMNVKQSLDWQGRIIAISGRLEARQYLDLAKALGADNVLFKPFGREDLKNCINKVTF